MAGEALQALKELGEVMAKSVAAQPAAVAATPAAATPQPSEIEDLKKSVETIGKNVEGLMALLAPKTDTTEAGPVLKAVSTATEELTAINEILNAHEDKLDKLTGATVLRKSAAGDDATAAGQASGQEAVQKSAVTGLQSGYFDNVMRQVMKNPGTVLTLK